MNTYSPWANYANPDQMTPQRIGDASTDYVVGASVFWFAILGFFIWLAVDSKNN